MADPAPLNPSGSSGGGWKRWGLGAAGFILLLFFALNSQSVSVNFIFGSANMPLIFALLIAAALGAVVGWAAPRLRRPKQ